MEEFRRQGSLQGAWLQPTPASKPECLEVEARSLDALGVEP